MHLPTVPVRMAVVKCQSLRKEFEGSNDKIIAVDSVDMVIGEGEFATIVGPSGCGKTTLLRMIAGLETPTSGDIFFDDTRVNDIKPQNRNISMVFQNIALFPFKNVRDNIGYGLKYSDLDGDEIDNKVTEMAEMVNISQLLDQNPNQLSGGQQQRVALARALVRDPDVFLLDEPMSDLDAKLKSSMRTELKRLHKNLPKTTLYVTHDQHEALTLSTEVIVMRDGKIQQQAPPNVVFERPSNLFVAKFIGSPTVNVFEGAVNGNEIIVPQFEHAIDINQLKYPDINLNVEDVRVGVRPSSLHLAEDSEQSMINGTIQLLEKVGNETVLYIDIGDGENEVRVLTTPDGSLTSGMPVNLQFDPESLHLFDPVSGENLIYRDSNREVKAVGE